MSTRLVYFGIGLAFVVAFALAAWIMFNSVQPGISELNQAWCDDPRGDQADGSCEE